MAETDISFVIVNWNTREMLLQCLSVIYNTATGLRFEVIVVDNGSADGSLQAVQERYPRTRCIANEKNRGFGAANNQAFAVMTGRYALLINTDAMLTPGALDTLYAFMEHHPEAGMACGQLLNPDGSKQNAHASFPSLLTLMVNESLLKGLFPGKYPSKYHHHDHPLPVDSCIGACMIVRKTAMDQVGFFDERYFFFFEETDWARQFRKRGWEIYFIPEARIVHYQGQSAGAHVAARKLFYYSRYQYLWKWHRRQFPLMIAVILLRLAINALLNTIAVVLTAGLQTGTRFRCQRYWRLLGWHLAGCPFPHRDTGTEKSIGMLIKGTPQVPPPRRGILLIQIGDIGDVVLTMPTVRALREHFPHVTLGVCVREKARELVEDSAWVDEVISINERKRGLLEEIGYQTAFFRALRQKRFDWAIELRSTDRGAFLAVLSGASVRIGRAAPDRRYWRDRLYTHVVSPPAVKELHEYAVEHSLNIISPFDIEPGDRRPVLHVPDDRYGQAMELLEQQGVPLTAPLVVIHPFSLWSYKEWQIDQWIGMVDFIRQAYNATIVITGSKEERIKAEKIVTRYPTGVYNLAGLTSIGALSAVLKHSRAFIGVDTGALHMAAAVGTPTLSLFGPSPTVMWAPRGADQIAVTARIPCVPCRDKGCNHMEYSYCLDSLRFEEFREQLRHMLDTALGEGQAGLS